MTHTQIIAEIGVNHDGSLEQAFRLIDCCVEAGVDVVKFQTFSADRLVLPDAPKADYQIKQDGAGSQYEMLKRLELSLEDHHVLMEYCQTKKVEFLSTGFDEINLAMLVELGIKQIKIPSGELTNLPYLKTAASYRLPILLSTGMATMDEVEAAVSALLDHGLAKENLTILHCTSSYPAADEDLNLNAMITLKNHFDVAIGYSDHSEGIEASIVAASMGASVIEKHVTLDRGLPGPDHKASIEPDEITALVKTIRRKDLMLGSSLKTPSASELNTAKVARKSIVAKRDIKKGERLTPENLMQKRPGTGLSPMLWDEVINSHAIADFALDDQIRIKANEDD